MLMVNISNETSNLMSWLLEKNFPSVRLGVLIDLMDKKISNPGVIETQNNIIMSPEIINILEAQNKERYSKKEAFKMGYLMSSTYFKSFWYKILIKFIHI